MKLAEAARLSCAALLAGLLACGAAQAETKMQTVAGVTRIQFKLPGELEVRQGSDEKLTVDAHPSVMPKIDIAVKGDTLVLSSKGSFKTEHDLKFKVVLKALRGVKSEGSGKTLVLGFSGGEIDVQAAGSGDMTLKDIKPERLAIVVKGAGNVDAIGGGKSLLAHIEGTGAINAAGFRARQVDAAISGSGDIRVHAEEALKASISGAGNIGYKGKPKLTQSVSGAGSIEPL